MHSRDTVQGKVTTAEASSQSSRMSRAQTVPCSAEPQDRLAITVDHELQPISVAFGSSEDRGVLPVQAQRRETGGAGQNDKFQPAGSSILHVFEGKPPV